MCIRDRDVGDVPWRRSKDAQQRLRMRRAGADFDIQRLLDQAALRSPVMLQLEDEVLKRLVLNRPVIGAAARSARERTVALSRGAWQSTSDESVQSPATRLY